MTKNTWKYYGNLAWLAKTYLTLHYGAMRTSDTQRKKEHEFAWRLATTGLTWRTRFGGEIVYEGFKASVLRNSKFMILATNFWTKDEVKAVLEIFSELGIKNFIYEYKGSRLMENLLWIEECGWRNYGMVRHTDIDGSVSLGMRIIKK